MNETSMTFQGPEVVTAEIILEKKQWNKGMHPNKGA